MFKLCKLNPIIPAYTIQFGNKWTCICVACFSSPHSKRFNTTVHVDVNPFTHTHSYTAGCQHAYGKLANQSCAEGTAIRSDLGFSVLPMDIMRTAGAGIEPLIFQLLDDRLYLLSNSHPSTQPDVTQYDSQDNT